ncbi:MAG: hypothetical protein COV44_04525 [Deltaproteobacteria bacterium CG11_big_fil_rev_8_21_14_0_20_45_16]|nr:MAG: hypothetical protein COV44_04525 [Deltaproteobacteria bacterium CG11_big_fil_rev_8_21_14_0_20_45_16]
MKSLFNFFCHLSFYGLSSVALSFSPVIAQPEEPDYVFSEAIVPNGPDGNPIKVQMHFIDADRPGEMPGAARIIHGVLESLEDKSDAQVVAAGHADPREALPAGSGLAIKEIRGDWIGYLSYAWRNAEVRNGSKLGTARKFSYFVIRTTGLAALLYFSYDQIYPTASFWAKALPVGVATTLTGLSQYFIRRENDWLGFQNNMTNAFDIQNAFKYRRLSEAQRNEIIESELSSERLYWQTRQHSRDFEDVVGKASDPEEGAILLDAHLKRVRERMTAVFEMRENRVPSSFFKISLKEFAYGGAYVWIVSLMEQVGRWSGNLPYPDFPMGVEGVFQLPDHMHSYFQGLSTQPLGYLFMVPIAYSVFAFLSDGAVNYVNVAWRNIFKKIFHKHSEVVEEISQINKLAISLGLTTLYLAAKQGSEGANEALVKIALPSAILFGGLAAFELSKFFIPWNRLAQQLKSAVRPALAQFVRPTALAVKKIAGVFGGIKRVACADSFRALGDKKQVP